MDVMLHMKMLKDILSVFCTICFVTNFSTAAQDGSNGKKDQECHNYAGGHVYPGEAFRVPVSDHSLHLSKAKSGYCPFPPAQLYLTIPLTLKWF